MIEIIGAVVSLIVQYLKTKYGTGDMRTLVILITISILAGAIYVIASPAEYWPIVIRIIETAAAIYVIFIRRLEGNN